jgi:hypothetical protein
MTRKLNGSTSMFLLAFSLTLPACESTDIAAANQAPRFAVAETVTEFPSAEDQGGPFYARIDPEPPFIHDDGIWAAIVFYRDPACVPAGFNLLQFFDPAAEHCDLMVSGRNIWENGPGIGAPKIVNVTGSAVPVWFVPAAAAHAAIEDGTLTIVELAGLAGRITGTASQYQEVLHPHPLPPFLGGGGHPVPKITISARGTIDGDGRRFHFQLIRNQRGVNVVRIDIR